MSDILFLTAFGLVLTLFLNWGFRNLPGDRWQMLAVVPLRKGVENSWQGANLTYYGFFIATGQLLSVVLLLVLLGAMYVSLAGTMLALGIILAVSLPAARLVAVIVERKHHTFTVGGASFIGILIAPWAVMMAGRLVVDQGGFLPVMPVLAAMSIAYTLGEGLGRLGCISFGCCYGKPVNSCHPLLQKLFANCNFIFDSPTKKAAYEGQLCGERLIPIQAITCVLYTGGALIGSFLFLEGCFTAAMLTTIALTQIWRILSEMLRADFRGFGKISAYQKMAAASLFYMTLVAALVPSPSYIDPNVANGIGVLWDPIVILALQILWLVFFLMFGRSTVTTSTVSFDLVEKHI